MNIKHSKVPVSMSDVTRANATKPLSSLKPIDFHLDATGIFHIILEDADHNTVEIELEPRTAPIITPKGEGNDNDGK